MSVSENALKSVFSGGEAILGGVGKPGPVVLSTRIRLARNLAGHSFPGWAGSEGRAEVLNDCMDALARVESLSGASSFKVSDLSETERLVLVESHLISRELMGAQDGAGVVIEPNQGCSVMVNEEDHLRIQMVHRGMALEQLWKNIDALDTSIEEHLDYAFSEKLGYLTACPTNLGTGMRASAMMHLPGLVLAGHMEQVIRMVNQLGMAVRGHFGEGTEATGSIFQISNQQTLGEDERTIIRRLGNVLGAVVEQELNSRQKLLEEKREKLLDKIGRARGILANGHLLSSDEAMDLLSLIRMAADMGMLPESWRAVVDGLMIRIQPGHLQTAMAEAAGPERRDAVRAKIMREEFAQLPPLTHITEANSSRLQED